MIAVVAGVVRRGERLLLCQRPEGKRFGMLWEFPGGKIEAGESPEAALERELREELHVETRTGRVLTRCAWTTATAASCCFFFTKARSFSGEPQPWNAARLPGRCRRKWPDTILPRRTGALRAGIWGCKLPRRRGGRRCLALRDANRCRFPARLCKAFSADGNVAALPHRFRTPGFVRRRWMRSGAAPPGVGIAAFFVRSARAAG